MADTISWTEPLDSTAGWWYLGIEWVRGCGERRIAAHMSMAGVLPILETRCEHYVRRWKRGQRDGYGRASPARRWRRRWGECGASGASVRAHGGGRGWGASAAMNRRVPWSQWGHRPISMPAVRCQNPWMDSAAASGSGARVFKAARAQASMRSLLRMPPAKFAALHRQNSADATQPTTERFL